MSNGKIRIESLVKFLNLCVFTTREIRRPTIKEIMQKNKCSKSNAYNYLRALKYLYPDELLDSVRQSRQVRSVQQTLE